MNDTERALYAATLVLEEISRLCVECGFSPEASGHNKAALSRAIMSANHALEIIKTYTSKQDGAA